MAGSWEVEQKFHVDHEKQLYDQLSRLGFAEQEVERHADTYFRHPCRDFRQTDEAFRVRLVNDQSCVTYKGPREPGIVKTRAEIELSILTDEHPQWRSLLERLGFAALPTVKKTRRIFRATSQPLVVVDNVEQLGLFAEIEVLVSDRAELEPARERIVELGAALGLSRIQHRSYLSQLLDQLGIT